MRLFSNSLLEDISQNDLESVLRKANSLMTPKDTQKENSLSI